MERILLSRNIRKKFDNGQLIYIKNAPNTIFKYRTGNEKNFEALESNRIFLSNMTIQDDRFEGKYKVTF